MSTEVLARLDEIATRLPPERWMLVGGLMVHAHALLAGVQHERPTDDADLVVELATDTYASAASAVLRLGYATHEPIDAHAPFHRFTRGADHIDLMVPVGATVRYGRRDVIAVPGARSAARRTIPFVTPGGTQLRLPDLGSALSLKGAASTIPTANAVRHLQDAVTLFACADGQPLDLSRSMRKNVNHLIAAMARPEAWSFAPPDVRRRAARAVLGLRPDWDVPGFVLARRARPERG